MGDIRKRVRLVAWVDPPIADMPVYFKVWDVDDPFDQLHADMTDIDLVDADMSGPDNRPVGEAPQAYCANTDENGRASVTVIVSMQPGNNYRAAASCLQDALDQAGQTGADALSTIADPETTYAPNGDFTGYKVPVVWSKMLTVWRRLTLEVDSMGQESQDPLIRETNVEWVRCHVAALQVGQPAEGFTTVDCSVVLDTAPEVAPAKDAFEGGALIRTDTGQETLVVRNSLTSVFWHIDVILWGDPDDIVDRTLLLRDDDQYFSDPADTRQLPRTSVLTSEIISAYASAYVDVIDARAQLNANVIASWISNLEWPQLNLDYTLGIGVAAHKDLESVPDYWCRRLLLCYQPGVANDWDSDGHENAAVSVNVRRDVDAAYPNDALNPLFETMDQMGIISGVTISAFTPALHKSSRFLWLGALEDDVAAVRSVGGEISRNVRYADSARQTAKECDSPEDFAIFTNRGSRFMQRGGSIGTPSAPCTWKQ